MSDADRIAALEVRVEKLEAVIRALGAAFGGNAGNGGDVATDRELDTKYGDPKVAFVPSDFKGGSVAKGQSFSRCPPEFLDLFADIYAGFARKNDALGNKDAKGRPKGDWDRKTTNLARGWARRIRAGWTPPPAAAAPSFGANDGGFGVGTTRSWGSDGSFANGGRGFLGAAPPAVVVPPLAPTEGTPTAPEDDSFDFGHNVTPSATATAAQTPTTEDFDDDPPL